MRSAWTSTSARCARTRDQCRWGTNWRYSDVRPDGHPGPHQGDPGRGARPRQAHLLQRPGPDQGGPGPARTPATTTTCTSATARPIHRGSGLPLLSGAAAASGSSAVRRHRRSRPRPARPRARRQRVDLRLRRRRSRSRRRGDTRPRRGAGRPARGRRPARTSALPPNIAAHPQVHVPGLRDDQAAATEDGPDGQRARRPDPA